MDDLSGECMCRGAVERAYRELRKLGESDVSAFDTAARVYRYHLPEVPMQRAKAAIADWLD